MGHKNSEQHINQIVSNLFWKLPSYTGGMTPRAFQCAVSVNMQGLIQKHALGAFGIGSKKMEADPEKQHLTGVKACHVFLRQKTGDPVGIKLRLGNVRVYCVIKRPEHHDVLVFIIHFPGVLSHIEEALLIKGSKSANLTA